MKEEKETVFTKEGIEKKKQDCMGITDRTRVNIESHSVGSSGQGVGKSKNDEGIKEKKRKNLLKHDFVESY